MKTIAKSKRIKAFFGLVFPLLYIPYPLYYNYRNPGKIVIDDFGAFLIVIFVCLTLAYYAVNGIGFYNSLLSRNVFEFDDEEFTIIIFRDLYFCESEWTDFSIVYSFGLPFIQIRKNGCVVASVYANCADINNLPKKIVRNRWSRLRNKKAS